MIFLLKVIAYGMMFHISSKLFPTFWGGVLTAQAIFIVSIIGSVATKVKVGKK